MKIVEISEVKFNNLSIAEPGANYQQTSNWANFNNYLECKPLYLGYADDSNHYSAFAMILVKAGKTIFSKKTAICPSGFLINYYDTDLLNNFTTDLKKYLSKKGISELTISPNVEYLTARGNNDYLIKSMKELGYQKTDDNFYFTNKISKISKAKLPDGVRLKTYVVEKKYRKIFQDNETYRSLYDNMLGTAKFIVCELDHENTVCGLNEEINDAKVFIKDHEEDIEYIRKVESKKSFIAQRSELMSLVEKCVADNGENPVLAITCLIEYNKTITQLFVESKNDYGSFKAVDILNEKTLRFIKELGYDNFISYKPYNNSQKVELIGEFKYSVK